MLNFFKTFLKFILFFLIFNLSCITAMKNKKNNIKTSPEFEKIHYQKLNNFIFFTSFLINNDNKEITPEANASGFVFKTKDNYNLLITAGHFCSPDAFFNESLQENIERKIIAVNKEEMIEAKILMSDVKNDICILSTTEKFNQKFDDLLIADKMPKIGEKIYSVSAPLGIYTQEIHIIFEGYFDGCSYSTDSNCIFSIPAINGSSGSAIYNEKGELISIIDSTAKNFNNIAIGPNIYAIKEFIKYF